MRSMLGRTTYLADVFQPTKGAPPELDSSVSKVLGFIAWVGTAAGVVGILAVGTMMAVSVKRGEGSEHMGKLAMVLGGCVLVATAGPIIRFLFA
ncbi:hypothetical protein [Kitasatospora sp. KL5]|uniref:hypothetical protein n=1 Tax=Kitasatospora sp. KL5 TaxID=3425125 RepID=UPI003D6DE4B5